MVIYKLLINLFLEYGTVFLIASCISFIILNEWKDRRKKSSPIIGQSYPPGPASIPFLGYLPFLSLDAHLDFCKLKDKYGPIFSLKLGMSDVVV